MPAHAARRVDRLPVTEVNDEPIEQIAAGANSTEDESSAASSSSGSSDAVSTVTVNAALHNTDADASALEVNALCADGIYRNVASAAVEDLENGRVDITVDTQALASLVATNEAPSDSASPDGETAGNVALAQDAAADGFAILSIDAGEIALAYGGAVDPGGLDDLRAPDGELPRRDHPSEQLLDRRGDPRGPEDLGRRPLGTCQRRR